MESGVSSFFKSLLLVLTIILNSSSAQSPLGTAKSNDVEIEALKFVQKAENELHEASKEYTVLSWASASNITDYNDEKELNFSIIFDALSLKLGKEAQKFDLNQIQDKELKRKLKDIGHIGTSVLEGEDLEKYTKLVKGMEKIYSTAKVPKFNDKSKSVSLEPEMTLKMAKSRNAEELKYYWLQHRDTTGKKMRDMYKEFIKFTNKAAKLNGFKDGTEMKTVSYESNTFVDEMAQTWQGLKPLYEQLHAYVRYHLNKKYGNEIVDPNGPMPAHLLGNMWAQSWGNIAELVKPYPNKPSIDVSEAMKNQGWTPQIMFEKADDFFQSIGFEPMNSKFWKNSIIEKPEDREMVCHASAWDFYTGDDFRIKMCTRVNQEDFVTVNHEMGHIQYYMNYNNLSYLFRNGANPGFHEGIADILSLAVGTASYYQRLGLLDEDVDIGDKEVNINILFQMALQRLAFMPFGYLVDKYRWDLYSGKVSLDDMNCHWVKLRSEIQGIKPPTIRSEDDFDAGAKYHVAANVGYVRYFTAFVYQFQFYKTLCQISKQYDPNDPIKPLHHCNFYGSKEAGDKLRLMLELGSSRPWKEVMEVMTGQPDMDTSAFREYFKPLEDWLKEQNAKNNVNVGWINPKIQEICTSTQSSSASPMMSTWTLSFYFAIISVIYLLVH